MKRSAVAVALALWSLPSAGLSPEAREFMAVAKQLEPVHCEKRKLRREIVMAEVERRDGEARELRARFEALDRDAKTARLQRRLAELERRLSAGARDPGDLEALSLQQREAFYRCE
ncbi:MAG: hypothetical protein A3D95_04375 [Betaproteobacteria bacterium RIFCSPHIGHO2_12_FULL_69_13]|nr:MAG: hypothetical protein A3D95_04375 [Betaproteobacteria bacterium RIFCSPHIGHO2_12_FULL_69_13]OGA68581.1 MAG: hypothetical protein A3G83_08790 [Betaproteobacteria bacterium RIFCSPLOWO2_12_FULL_68_20]